MYVFGVYIDFRNICTVTSFAIYFELNPKRW